MSEPTLDREKLKAYAAVEEEPNRQGKSQRRRTVSMLTPLIQRSNHVAHDPFEYEYEGTKALTQG